MRTVLEEIHECDGVVQVCQFDVFQSGVSAADGCSWRPSGFLTVSETEQFTLDASLLLFQLSDNSENVGVCCPNNSLQLPVPRLQGIVTRILSVVMLWC